MDIEAMPKPDWRENLKALLEIVRQEKAETIRKDKAERLEKARIEAQELCDCAVERLKVYGVEVERTETRERTGENHFLSICHAGGYWFEVEWINGLKDTIRVKPHKSTEFRLLGTNAVDLRDRLDFESQMRLAELLEALDKEEAEEEQMRETAEVLETIRGAVGAALNGDGEALSN